MATWRRLQLKSIACPGAHASEVSSRSARWSWAREAEVAEERSPRYKLLQAVVAAPQSSRYKLWAVTNSSEGGLHETYFLRPSYLWGLRQISISSLTAAIAVGSVHSKLASAKEDPCAPALLAPFR